jgi:hypothetical protein
LLDEIFVQILKTFYVAGWEMLLELITVWPIVMWSRTQKQYVIVCRTHY